MLKCSLKMEDVLLDLLRLKKSKFYFRAIRSVLALPMIKWKVKRMFNSNSKFLLKMILKMISTFCFLK